MSVVLAGALLSWGCDTPVADTAEAEAPAPVSRDRPPVDPGEEGTSRNLLQHYRARELAGGKLAIRSGKTLGYEARAWQLPFQSKRMIASLLTAIARGSIDDVQHVLAPNATFGRPDARRPHERPIFEGNNLERFFDGFAGALARFEETADYTNPTSFLMGLQENLRTGAEPMWAYYSSGHDRILFRFRVYGSRAYIDYVGFNEDAPTGPMDYSALGPEVAMMPGIRMEDGRVVNDFDPRKQGAKKRRIPAGGMGAGRGAPPPRRPRQ
ncbi:MAG: hypothetical protein AAGA54_23595 [Myxococcota bacterium]